MVATSMLELVVYAVIICAFGIALGLLLGMARPQVLDWLERVIDPPERAEPVLPALERVCRRRGPT